MGDNHNNKMWFMWWGKIVINDAGKWSNNYEENKNQLNC